MSKNIVHIYGASGSGVSTLGRKLCAETGWRLMDTDDYFWLPTDPKYTTKRERSERLALMRRDVAESENAVISGSLSGWGDPLIPLFTLAIRLVTPTEVRIARLKQRESAAFGARILPGGDMYEAHLAFMDWARAYDDGPVDMRSKACHDEWEKLLSCDKLTLDGTSDPDENCEVVLDRLGFRTRTVKKQ